MERFQKFAADVQRLINRLQDLRTRTERLLPSIDQINELVNKQYEPNARRLDSTLSEPERASAQAEWESRQQEIEGLCRVLKESQPDIHQFSRDLESFLARIPMHQQFRQLRQEIESLRFPRTIDPRLKELAWKETAELMAVIELRLEEMCEVVSVKPTPTTMTSERTVQTSPLETFCSYSHCDEKLRNKLEAHLAVLKSEGLISSWHDRLIGPGSEWKNCIDSHLNSAAVILLLVSADFLASKYCYDVELKRALERHEEGCARVIPIILRPCDWKNSPIGKLQALPKDGKPVTSWRPRDSAFTDIIDALRKVIHNLRLPHTV